MRKSIQCWQCGTRMTLDALASNDGDCPECEVEIHLGDYLSEALDTNQRLEAELAALKAKAAVPGWMTTPEAFAERAYHAGWCDLADAQHEGIAVMYDELAAAPAQPQSDGVLMPVSDVEEYISLLIDEADAHLHGRHQPEMQAHMRAEIERVRALLGGEA